jgi:hypothetical protein
MESDKLNESNKYKQLLILSWIAFAILATVGYNVLKVQQNQSGGTQRPIGATPALRPMVYEEHVIKYNDSDLQFGKTNLKYQIQQIPFDLNGDGVIDSNDVRVYIANQLLSPNESQVKDGQTIIIPYGSDNKPNWSKGSIVRIEYGVSN